ncbi:hypothetical protein [Dolichospermum compactum]|uniref:Uncharacterized protein n=1 Tax=Dolichospermum compactum NIES-806 TaxID=1973481 RepID=A0A1Z4UXV7_9CYAN|nr:hypothetical protein [Dolichospermum compactum]BAZ84102.1 hypothetical protein NIES806_02850 [Dolichospermum compactum NIES-806]
MANATLREGERASTQPTNQDFFQFGQGDEEELIIPVLGGNELQDILLGVRWLQSKRLVADFTAGVLTLG